MALDTALPAPIRALPLTGAAIPAYRLAAHGCEVLFAVAEAGSEIPQHSHDTENATVIISGETILITGENEQRYGPGEWYQTQPGQMHAVRFETDTIQIELRFAAPAHID